MLSENKDKITVDLAKIKVQEARELEAKMQRVRILGMKKIIMINSLKGGVGKSTIAFCILKYLVSLKKKVKVFDFDDLNHGLSIKIEKFLTKSQRRFLDVEQIFHSDFFRCSIKNVSQIYLDYDYIILDGHIFPGEYIKVQKMVAKLLCLIYIVPDDDCISEKDLRLVVGQYTKGLQQRLIFLYNLKNNKPSILSDHKSIVLDEIKKTCKRESIDELKVPKEADKAIGYYSDISDLYGQYHIVSELLIERLRSG